MFQARKSTHRLSLRGLEAVQACAKKNRSLKTCFSAKPRLHPIRPFIRGHATPKMNRKGELQTSRISSNLRIWQSFSRVPQNLKVLCVWYSWKYVARLGFEPLKFLYSEFLYNTQAVRSCLESWNPQSLSKPSKIPGFITLSKKHAKHWGIPHFSTWIAVPWALGAETHGITSQER